MLGAKASRRVQQACHILLSGETDCTWQDQYESLEFLLREACREQQVQQQQRQQQQEQPALAEGEQQSQREGDAARGQGNKPQLVLVGATPAADSLVERYVQQVRRQGAKKPAA